MAEGSGAWLVIGLGNPGPEYEWTPHNLGFLVIDRLAEANRIRVTRKDLNALLGAGAIGGAPALLAKPQTFMNLSGPPVKLLMAKHGIGPDRLIVVYDELDLPWGSVRIRPQGSAAGHNGMESVIRSVGTQDFPRVRLGIHPGHPVKDGAEFVLTPLRKAQVKELDELLDHAARAVESVIAEGVTMSMTKFNRRARGLTQEEK